MKFDINKITDYEVENATIADYPDFSDGHVTYCIHDNKELNDRELDELNDDHDLVYDLLYQWFMS